MSKGDQPAKPALKELLVAKLRRQGETQARASINETQIMHMTELLKRRKAKRPHDDDRDIPPIDVFFDGKDYWIGDGNQRTEAHARAAVAYIQAWVRPGTKLDAFVWNIKTNIEHRGKQWDTADGKHAATALLKSEEATAVYSSRDIAKLCGISYATVERVRKGMSEAAHLTRIADNQPAPQQEPWQPPKKGPMEMLKGMTPGQQLEFRRAAEAMVVCGTCNGTRECPTCQGFGKVNAKMGVRK